MDKEKKQKRSYLKYAAFFIAAVFVSCFIYMDASAYTNLLYRTELWLYAGDNTDLSKEIDDYFININYDGKMDEDNPGKYTITYKWNEENPAPSCASLSEDGIVSTTEPGKVKIDVTFTYMDIVHTETITVNILAPQKISGEYGKKYSLDAYELYENGYIGDNDYDDDYYDDDNDYYYGIYKSNSSNYSFICEGSSGTIDEYGEVRVEGFTGFDVYAVKSDNTKFKVAEVDVVLPELNANILTAAVGTKRDYPVIKNYSAIEGDGEIQWSSENDIISLDKDKIIALKTGKTEISVSLKARNGDGIKMSCQLIVTDPKISKKEMVMAEGTEGKLSVTGICDNSTVTWSAGNDYGIDVTSKGVVYAYNKGTHTLKVTADGRLLQCKIIVTNPYFNVSGVSGYKGYKKSLSIKGIKKGKSKVSYKSSNNKIATVSQTGKVTCKKIGHAKITVTADGKKIVLNVEIASVKGYKAAQRAISISKTKTVYSQAQRMSKGKYDCSSLVWRVYSKYGYYFGVRRGWAPTAADIGKWCSSNHKVIACKGVSSDKLLPGDLVFYSYQKNGRYKNISHVEMYTGLGMDVSASSSNNKVIHYDYYPSDYIVMIARPAK